MAFPTQEYGNYSNLTQQTSGPEQDLTLFYFYITAFLASILIITLFSTLEKFAGSKSGQRGCCRSRIFPVDLMDTSESRFGYAAAFGSTSSTILLLFFKTLSGIPSWSKTLILLFVSMVVGLLFYPLFLCLTTDWVFLGSLLGGLYSGIMFSLNLRMVINSPAMKEDTLLYFPVIVCSLVLIIVYIHRFIKHTLLVWRNSQINTILQKNKRSTLATDYNISHVGLLLQKPTTLDSAVTDTVPGVTDRIKQTVSSWMYKNDPTFKYSTRILSVVTVSIICAYQFGVIIILVTKSLLDNADALTRFSDNVNTTAHNLTGPIVTFLYGVRLWLNVLSGSALVSFSLASLFTLYSISRILVNYRYNITQMFKGAYRHFPFDRHNRNSHVILSDSLGYAGSQIAYILWGYIITFAALFIVGILFALFIVLPLAGKISKSGLLFVVTNLLPPVLVFQLFLVMNKLFCKWRLMERTVFVDEKGSESFRTELALKRRNCYHNVSYFLFFFYIMLGLVGCLATIIKSIVLGVYYLARLDRCSLCQGFETFDRGYMIYLSFLYVESSHKHPVVLVFCDLLNEAMANREVDVRIVPFTDDSHGNRLPGPESRRASATSITVSPYPKRVRNKWLKAYTLINNPNLVLNENR